MHELTCVELDRDEAATLLGTTAPMLNPLGWWLSDGGELVLELRPHREPINRRLVPAADVRVGQFTYLGIVEHIDRTPKGVRLHGDTGAKDWMRSAVEVGVADEWTVELSGTLYRLDRQPDVLLHSELGTSILSMLGFQHEILAWWSSDGWTCRSVSCPCILGVGA